MFTELRIPHELKQLDPEWLSKKHSGRALSAQEKELYLKYRFDKDHKFLRANMRAPGG